MGVHGIEPSASAFISANDVPFGASGTGNPRSEALAALLTTASDRRRPRIDAGSNAACPTSPRVRALARGNWRRGGLDWTDLTGRGGNYKRSGVAVPCDRHDRGAMGRRTARHRARDPAQHPAQGRRGMDALI